MDYFQNTASISGQNVSRETFSQLETFANLLLKWNAKINLVSKKITINELWLRHILDSVQLLPYLTKDKKEILDFGSGAGFPGIILAIMGNCNVTLVESDQRKCAFLQEIISSLSLSANVLNARIEDIKPLHADIIISRALAPLTKLLHYSQPFVEKDNFMLFLKGQNVVEEIEEASISWEFTHQLFPDALGKDGGVLKISNLRRL